MNRNVIYTIAIVLAYFTFNINAQVLTESKRIQLASGTAPTAVTWDGTSFWIATAELAQEIDPTNGSVISSFPVVKAMDGIDFNFQDNLLYFTDAGTDDAYTYKRDGEFVLEMVQPNWDGRGQNPRDIEFINGEFWAVDSRNAIGQIFKHSLPGWERIDSIAITTGNSVKGVGYDGVSLWVSYSGTNEIEQFDFATKTSQLVIDGSTIGLVEPMGIDWDNSLLWIADAGADALVGYTVSSPTSIEKLGIIPTNYSLLQNFPNPFNPTTKINYSIVESGKVSLKVYDILGTEVAELVNVEQNTGTYSVDFDASNLSTGVYLYTLRVNNFISTNKMILMK